MAERSLNRDKVDLVRRGLVAGRGDWVLFDNGSFVVFRDAMPEDDIESAAIRVMRERGAVVPGTPSADFQVTALEDVSGWVVRGDVDGLYIYVQPEELESENPDELEIGMFARTIRQLDHEDLVVLHVERAC